MSAWERWGKRITKGFLWVPVYLGSAWAVGIDPTWQLLVVVILCGFWSDILEILIPTRSER